MKHQAYEIVEAESGEDAIAKSGFRVGQCRKIVDILTLANSDGTYSVFPRFDLSPCCDDCKCRKDSP